MNLGCPIALAWARGWLVAVFFIVFTQVGALAGGGTEKFELPPLANEDTAEAHLRLGIDFFLTDELDVAIREFREAARQRPGYAEAYHNLGVTLAKTGDVSGAIAAWTEADRLDPSVVSTRYRIAALVAYNYGVSLLQDKQLPDAMEQWHLAIRLQPNFVEAHYALGLGYGAAGNPLPAVTHFQYALHWAPSWAKAYGGLGLAFYESHDYGRAQEAWLRARELEPKEGSVYANLGLLAVQEGNFQQAIDYSRKALELEPTLGSAHFNLGLALFRKGEEEASLKSFETAWALDPSLTSAPLLMGIVKSHQGHWGPAASLWREALRRNPLNSQRIWLRFNRGLALTMMGNAQDAVSEFRMVVEEQPGWAPGWTQFGQTFMVLHQWEQAARAFQKAAGLDPQSAHLPYILGRTLLEQGRLDEAGQAFDQAVRIEPSFIEAQYQLGLVLRAQNRLPEAMEPLRLAAEGGSRQAQGLLASMYANGSGVDRNLPLAMLWWFRDGQAGELTDGRSGGHQELSRLRGDLYGQRLSASDRQEVLAGFDLIRQELTQPDALPIFSTVRMNGDPNWQSLQPSEAVLPWVIQLALALDGRAQETLVRWYEQGESREVVEAATRIQDYFLQTGKEGNPHSCQVIQRIVQHKPPSGHSSVGQSDSGWEAAWRGCRTTSQVPQLTQKRP